MSKLAETEKGETEEKQSHEHAHNFLRHQESILPRVEAG
jgi:hypothetical protein